MQNFNFTYNNFEELLKQYAKSFNVRIKDKAVILPEQSGKGSICYYQLNNGFQVLVNNFSVFNDITFQHQKTNEEFFILRLDEIVTQEEIDDESKSAAVLANTSFDWIFYVKKGAQINSIHVLFTKEWLNNFLDGEKKVDYIKKYLSLKLATFNYESLDAEYKRLMKEVLLCNDKTPLKLLVLQNRIMLLVERFFTRMILKINDNSFEVKVSDDDLKRLVLVEEELLKDFSIPPPGIPKLARMAAMSPSKLKIIFRDIYGLPIYQYFQKHRMNRAKAMLISQKYTVKEVGFELGYTNLSNFAKAFKKSFDQLPSDLFEVKT
ncbi:MAG TPA: helix-turn-helix transcriptional regulator [Chitinophagaceae bacterium]|nr:helix-turn-helix transcriptional regulator [Chitinophagaceae bacterium]HMZ46380.1 helix-turn-helix transcriptional regulator [Chitinophagaceae bacterium]HNE93125.1 helix-turn-helix transcriptional regulator [Chitinophagaceae bacterium]HNF29729.1 helix-turn-helix transcriptional regulator [Chitinophagaceae bacterium]HNJ57634.1 helix-turn-helix transcriptional regulator [Chitinophagaceae bacterium]